MKTRLRSRSRTVPFGAAVVWDALTDPVLVQGWLAPAARPVIGDRLILALDRVPILGVSGGALRSVEPGRIAVFDADPAGTVRFEVAAEAPLPTGRSRATCTIVAEAAHDLAAVGLVAAIDARLAALEELLSGRPVDWAAVEQAGSPGSERPAAGRLTRLD